MNLFSLFSFASFIIYLILGFYVFFLDKNSRSNRTFFFMTFSLAIWAFCYTFIYPAATHDTVLKWLFAASFGVFYIPGILLHFVMDLTLPYFKARKWWLITIYYLPGLVMHVRYFLKGYVTVVDVVPGPLGWLEVVEPSSFWFIYLNVYFFLYILYSVVQVIRWGRNSMRIRQKKQARLISFSLILTVIASLITDTLLPALQINYIPAVAPIFFLILAGGLWYSISRYRMMVLTPEIAADEIISRINELLFLVNTQGQIILANTKVHSMLGYSTIEIRGNYIANYIDMKDFNNNLLQDNFLFSEKLVMNEVHFISKSGENIPVELSCSPIKDKAQEVIGIVMVGQDLRMMHQLQALQKEKEYQNLKTRFITTASHEFRTPLATIQLSTETIQNHYHHMDTAKREEYFSLVYSSIKRMKNLLSDVLTLEKMSTQKIVVDYQEVHLKSLIHEIIQSESLQEENRHPIHLQYDLPEECVVYSDPKLLNNILYNLIGNSRKYTLNHDPIEVIIKKEKRNMVIIIKDKGIGISRSDLPRIFDSFHRGSNIGNISGTGLGLSIVKNSVDLLEGQITIDSHENKGTSIKVSLPFHTQFPYNKTDI